MKPSKLTGDTSATSRERGANYEFVQEVHGRDELVEEAILYAFDNRREFEPKLVAKVVADQAELHTPAADEIKAEIVNLDAYRRTKTEEAQQNVDSIFDETAEPVETKEAV